MEGGKSSELIHLGLIFLPHKNLAFSEGCVDFFYPLYFVKPIT